MRTNADFFLILNLDFRCLLRKSTVQGFNGIVQFLSVREKLSHLRKCYLIFL